MSDLMNDFENDLERLIAATDEFECLFHSISSSNKMSENARTMGRCDFQLDMIKNHLNNLKKYL